LAGGGGASDGVLEDLPELRAQTRALLLDPHVEWRFAERGTREEIARIRGDRIFHAAGARRGFEAVEVYDQPIRTNEPKALAILRKQIVANCRAQAMECLTERVTGSVFLDAAPEEVYDFVAPRLVPDSQQAE